LPRLLMEKHLKGKPQMAKLHKAKHLMAKCLKAEAPDPDAAWQAE